MTPWCTNGTTAGAGLAGKTWAAPSPRRQQRSRSTISPESDPAGPALSGVGARVAPVGGPASTRQMLRLVPQAARYRASTEVGSSHAPLDENPTEKGSSHASSSLVIRPARASHQTTPHHLGACPGPAGEVLPP